MGQNTLLERARQEFEMYRYEEAYVILNELNKSDTENVETLSLLGKIAYKKQKFGEAINYFNKILEIEPDNTDAKASLLLIGQIMKLTRNFYFENPYTDDALYE